MEERVDRLIGGPALGRRRSPPRVDGLAARLGIPPSVLDQLRAGGQLRHIAPGIDYPADVWSALQARIEGMRGPMSVARLRDELHTSRRHAEAILARGPPTARRPPLISGRDRGSGEAEALEGGIGGRALVVGGRGPP